MGAVSEATRENFDELVASGTTLVDVWGPDCRPCLALKPHVEKLAEARDDVKVVMLEAPEARRGGAGRRAGPGGEAARREAGRGARRREGRDARGAEGPPGVHPPQGPRT